MNTKSLIKNFFIYSFGAFFLRGISCLIAPITMRMLTPREYGLVSLMTSFVSIGTAVFGLGLRQVFSLEYFHCTKSDQKKLISTIVTIYTLISLPVLTCLGILHTYWTPFVFAQTVPLSLIIPALFLIFLFFFSELMYQILKFESKPYLLSCIQIASALCIGFCSIIFLYYFHLGPQGMLTAQCSGALIASSCAFYLYKKEYLAGFRSLNKRLSSIKYYLSYGLPFIPGILFNWILASGDRWVLAHYSTLHNVGIYAIADTFSQLFYFLVLVPWTGSYLPFMLKKFVNHKDKIYLVEQQNRKIMWLSICFFVLLISVSLKIFKPLFICILPSSYHPALDYIWILLLGQVCLLGSYFASCIIQYYKRTYFLAFSLCIPASINVVLNIMLIPHFGLYGCTYATLIAYGLYFASMLLYGRVLLSQLEK